MLVSWIYDNPVWLTSSVILLLAVGVSCVGLLVVRLLVDEEVRCRHNDMTGFTITNISVVFAVLLAFVAVATWDSFEKANTVVSNEANLIGRIARDAVGLGDGPGTLLRRDLGAYTSAVISEEWPAQQDGHISEAGASSLDRLQADVVSYAPQSRHDQVVMQEIFRCVNDLYAARRDRLDAATGHVPAVVWWVIILGGAVTIGYSFLFGVRSLGMHLAMTTAFTAALALVVILIVQLDYPFRGPVSASAEPYRTVLNELKQDEASLGAHNHVGSATAGATDTAAVSTRKASPL